MEYGVWTFQGCCSTCQKNQKKRIGRGRELFSLPPPPQSVCWPLARRERSAFAALRVFTLRRSVLGLPKVLGSSAPASTRALLCAFQRKLERAISCPSMKQEGRRHPPPPKAQKPLQSGRPWPFTQRASIIFLPPCASCTFNFERRWEMDQERRRHLCAFQSRSEDGGIFRFPPPSLALSFAFHPSSSLPHPFLLWFSIPHVFFLSPSPIPVRLPPPPPCPVQPAWVPP